jgi:hypothetical protein
MSKPGCGGGRALPWVFTITGVARLTTMLDATDRKINLFVAVRARVGEGRADVAATPPTRLAADAARVGTVQALRRKRFDALTTLLDTVVDPANQTTVRDELGDVSTHALPRLKEYLKTRGLENEKLHADIALILANARAVQERASAEVRKLDTQILENIKTRIGIVEQVMKMAGALEPSAVMTLLAGFPATRRLR